MESEPRSLGIGESPFIVPSSNYAGRREPESVKEFDAQIAHWISSKPGIYTSRNAKKFAADAMADFMKHAGLAFCNQDDFEIGVARQGYRPACIYYKYEPRWILVLPGSVDTALDRITSAEARPT